MGAARSTSAAASTSARSAIWCHGASLSATHPREGRRCVIDRNVVFTPLGCFCVCGKFGIAGAEPRKCWACFLVRQKRSAGLRLGGTSPPPSVSLTSPAPTPPNSCDRATVPSSANAHALRRSTCTCLTPPLRSSAALRHMFEVCVFVCGCADGQRTRRGSLQRSVRCSQKRHRRASIVLLPSPCVGASQHVQSELSRSERRVVSVQRVARCARYSTATAGVTVRELAAQRYLSASVNRRRFRGPTSSMCVRRGTDCVARQLLRAARRVVRDTDGGDVRSSFKSVEASTSVRSRSVRGR